MDLAVFSHKLCWRSSTSPDGYATDGGFPNQMQAISELFDETSISLPGGSPPSPPGLRSLTGHNINIIVLDEPRGRDLRRKLSMISWLPLNLLSIWRTVKQADAVHTPIPGDIGTIGMLVALAQRKPLFVRHCGSWGIKATMTNRFLNWLLPRIAGGRKVVMATGGGDEPPCPDNANIQWIFSTTLSKSDIKSLPVAEPWTINQPLRLVTVGRLTPGKNIKTILCALPTIIDKYQTTSLEIVGDGELRAGLEGYAKELGIEEKVRFHGNITHEQVIEILSCSHLFIFPTRGEGFPKVVLEAMACGLPVIASDVSVLPHLIGDKNGQILPETTPGVVSNEVVLLISDPRSLRDMSASARTTAGTYTLEARRDTIGERLQAAWGPLTEANQNDKNPLAAA